MARLSLDQLALPTVTRWLATASPNETISIPLTMRQPTRRNTVLHVNGMLYRRYGAGGYSVSAPRGVATLTVSIAEAAS